jgi:hypothetical protein
MSYFSTAHKLNPFQKWAMAAACFATASVLGYVGYGVYVSIEMEKGLQLPPSSYDWLPRKDRNAAIIEDMRKNHLNDTGVLVVAQKNLDDLSIAIGDGQEAEIWAGDTGHYKVRVWDVGNGKPRIGIIDSEGVCIGAAAPDGTVSEEGICRDALKQQNQSGRRLPAPVQ